MNGIARCVRRVSARQVISRHRDLDDTVNNRTIDNMAMTTQIPAHHIEMLNRIKVVDDDLTERFREKMQVNRVLDRSLVSFQANKAEVGHRWCKYREGFSAELIRYIIEETGLSGPILDPFAGSGTALFVAAEMGLDAIGIELLPCSAEIIQVRHSVLQSDKAKIAKGIRDAAEKRAWMKPGHECPFAHLQITAGAFPTENERHLGASFSRPRKRVTGCCRACYGSLPFRYLRKSASPAKMDNTSDGIKGPGAAWARRRSTRAESTA